MEKIYQFTESQLQELIEKVQNNIRKKTDKSGACGFGSALCESARQTIQSAAEKNQKTLSNQTTEIQAKNIIENLNQFGEEWNHYEFGLPTYSESAMNQMVGIVMTELKGS